MDEEIRRILKLLEEGKIKAEEAEKLIEALEEKRETKKRGSGILNIGEVITEAITSAVSVVPGIVLEGIKGVREVKESINWDIENPLYIEISGGDLKIDVGEDLRVVIEGKGAYSFQDNLVKLTAGEFFLLIPRMKVIKVNLSAGDIKGRLLCDDFEVYLKMGDGNLEVEADKVEGIVSMGDLDLNLINVPSSIKLNCSMGDIKLRLPEDFDGKIVTRVNMGDISIERKPDILKGDTFIYKTGEKCYVELKCSMGDIKVY